MTKTSRRSSISTIVDAEKEAASRQNVLAVAPPIEPVTLTPTSTVSTSFVNETAQEDFADGTRRAQDDGVDETIAITQRSREALPV